MSSKKYITTPIYYPNASLHMGHAYTNIVADTIKRFNLLDGKDAVMSTGSDEHGQKIQSKSKEEGESPKAYVDKIVKNFVCLWEKLDISYDFFNRTTSSNHEEFVGNIFTKLQNKGYIYSGTYIGYYCVSCETHYSEEKYLENDKKCSNCGKDLKRIEEESYFLKVSEFNDWVKEYLEKSIDITPENRKKELINNFLNEGLRDLSISRTSVEWGIPVPNSKESTIYVWFDALLNYLSGIQYDIEKKTAKYWDSDTNIVHILGKEITRFHCVYFPIILKMLGARLPDKFIAHGWLITEKGKMSKSLGNIIDPISVIQEYGSDPLRFYFSNNIRFNEDSKFSIDLLKESYNTNLVNLYGNTVSRTFKMIQNLYDGKVPKYYESLVIHSEFKKDIDELFSSYLENFRNDDSIEATKKIIELLRKTSKYIDESKPWTFKEKSNEISTILNLCFQATYLASTMLMPITTRGSQKYFNALDVKTPSLFSDIPLSFDNIQIIDKINLYDRKK
ncbi:MAG: methionine--tRNA ligase [Mycoplasmataceae bacterium]|nr:methionine--tRNA ligase [Mycoplasmataceae bacterium]